MKKEVIPVNDQNNLNQGLQQNSGIPNQPINNSNNQNINANESQLGQQGQPVQQPQVEQVMQTIQPAQQVQQPQQVQMQTNQFVNNQPQQTIDQVAQPQVSQQPLVQEQPQQIQQPQQVQQPIQQGQVNQDIVSQAPLNPLANNSGAPSNGVYGPSIPINQNNDATNIGFVASSAPLEKKKKNKGLLAVIIIIILIALGAVGYFVVYPYVIKTYFSDPKDVYSATIQEVFKGINSNAETLVHQKAIYDIEASFDTNIETLKPYTGYSYGLNIGVDPTKKTIQSGIIIKNNEDSTEHSYYKYLKDNKEYAKYSTYRGYIYLGEANLQEAQDIFTSFEDLFNNAEKLNNEEIQYLSNKISELLISSIDEKDLSKEDAVININNEELKVTNNKYTIDYNTRVKIVEGIVNGIKNDDKSIEILAKMSDITKDEVISKLDSYNFESEDDKKDEVYYVNIYTYGLKNTFVGIELTSKQDESKIYYYDKSNVFEFGLDYYSENIETGEKEKNSLVVSGTRNGNTAKVKITLNKKEIGNLDVKKWDNTGFEIDYSIKGEENDITGTVKFVRDVNEERAKFSFDLSVNIGEEYINFSIKFNEDWTSEVANINTDSADTLSEEEIAAKEQEFNNTLMETPIGIFFSTVSNDYDESIYNYYNNDTTQDNSNVITPIA